MKILISSSMKFRNLVETALKDMKNLGIDGIFPNLKSNDNNSIEVNTLTQIKKLAQEHYEAMNDADAVYFIVPNGYMGTSCKVELGYALALNKTIYFSEQTHDLALDCYVKSFIPLDDLGMLKNF